MNPPRAPLQLQTSCAASLVNSSPSRLVPLRVHHAATPFAICPLPWAVGLSLGCLRWAGGEATIARRRDIDRGERRQRVSISAMAIKCGFTNQEGNAAKSRIHSHCILQVGVAPLSLSCIARRPSLLAIDGQSSRANLASSSSQTSRAELSAYYPN